MQNELNVAWKSFKEEILELYKDLYQTLAF